MSDDINETTANLMEALSNLTSAIIEKKNALDDSTDEGMSAERKVAKELEDLGIVIKSGGGAFSLHNERLRQRAELEEEVNKKLRNNVDSLRDATDAEVEEYKNAQKRNELYNQELANIGRMIKANGDIVKTTIDLDKAQKKVIDNYKREDRLKQEQLQATEQFKDMLKNLPAQLGIIGITYAFDMLKAEVVGSYKAMIAMEDALLAGQEGLSVETAGTAARMQEVAKATAKLGSALSGAGDQFVMLGIAMTGVTWPIRLLSLAIGGILKLFGMYQEAQAAAIERDAEMEKKRGELNDKLADGFKKLGSAGLAGADGMTGLMKNLGKLNLNLNHLPQLERVLGESQKNLAIIGGNAIDGVNKVVDTAGTLIHSGLGTIIRRLGIQNDEMIAHTIAFMSQQARMGIKTTGDVAKSTGEYILELDRLALITGTTRKKEEEAREAIMRIAQLRAAAANAEMRGDEPRKQELLRAKDLAAAMLAAGETSDATHFAKLAAAGFGPQDAEQARLMSTMTETIKAVREGIGSAESRFIRSQQELAEREIQGSGATQYTGPIPGYTSGDIAPILDMKTMIGEGKFDANKTDLKGGDLADYIKKELSKIREVTDQKQIRQEAMEAANRDKAFQLQMQIMEGSYKAMERMIQGPAGTMLEAANKMLEAAKMFLKMLGGDIYQSGVDARKKWDAWDPFGRKSPAIVSGGGKGAAANVSGGQASTNVIGGKTSAGGKAVADKKGTDKPYFFAADNQGGESAFNMADPSLRLAVVAAATEYYDKSKGKKLQINSSYRDRQTQEGMYAESVAAGRAGTGPQGRPVAVPGTSPHERGIAVDIQNYDDPTALAAMYNAGLRQNVGNDAVHFQIPKAEKGGIFNGPKSGYPVELHGKEAVVPLPSATEKIELPKAATGGLFNGPKSGYPVELHGREAVVPLPSATEKIELPRAVNANEKNEFPHAATGGLFTGPKSGYPVELHGKEAVVPLPNAGDKLAVDKPKKEETVTKNSLSNITTSTSSNDKLNTIMYNMLSMMENKFDDMIYQLEKGNNYSDKIVKAMV
jgi:D-alanyl-D-alanine carboxypeptidase